MVTATRHTSENIADKTLNTTKKIGSKTAEETKKVGHKIKGVFTDDNKDSDHDGH